MRRGRSVSVVLAILLLAVLLVPRATASGPDARVQRHLSQVTVDPEGAYSKVTITGASAIKTPGLPALPAQYLRFVIPSDAK